MGGAVPGILTERGRCLSPAWQGVMSATSATRQGANAASTWHGEGPRGKLRVSTRHGCRLDPARRDLRAEPSKCTFSGSSGQKRRKSGIFEAFAPQRLTTTWAFTETYMATTRNIPRLTLFLTTRGDFARFSLSGGHEQEANAARSKAGSASQRATDER